MSGKRINQRLKPLHPNRLKNRVRQRPNRVDHTMRETSEDRLRHDRAADMLGHKRTAEID